LLAGSSLTGECMGDVFEDAALNQG
jgi:hypothetical protein